MRKLSKEDINKLFDSIDIRLTWAIDNIYTITKYIFMYWDDDENTYEKLRILEKSNNDIYVLKEQFVNMRDEIIKDMK